jgi:hypothetical protein
MQRREKLLAAILVAGIVMWQGGPLLSRAIFEPIDVRNAELDSLDQSIALKQTDQIAVARSERQLADWRSRSLPPDPLVAQRLYQEWLTDLAQNAGFSNLKVTPQRRTQRDDAFTTVEVAVTAEATLDQVSLFLYRFYRTDLLHRVSSMDLQSKQNQGNPPLKFTLTAEGLSLSAAPPRNRLFLETTLAQPLAIDDKALTVAEPIKLPAKDKFLARVGDEYLSVTAVTGNQWTVERGAEASQPAAHDVGQKLEIVPINAAAQQAAIDAYRWLVAARNPFAIPAPKVEPTPEPVVAKTDPPPPSLDPAQFAYLTGTISRGDDRKALFVDRLNNQRIVVEEGQPFSLAGIEASVVRIGADHVVLKQGEQQWRLEVGKNLRSMQRLVNED